VSLASRILAAADKEQFRHLAPLVGDALWSAAPADALKALGADNPLADDAGVARQLAAGTERRATLKHYSGGMFYYGGEWYWGVDRLYHLENRLIELGAAKSDAASLLAPRPEIVTGPLKAKGSLTLEVYPSLRSPYTSIIFDRTVELAKATGVMLKVRPVLPMVMRGVPATREKGMYIFSDTAREARTLGLEWGNAYDPIGNPVRHCYSLYPWARDQGKGVELLSAFLRAAFFDRVNTNNNRGMRRVVESAGLSWRDASEVIDNDDWQAEVETNRLAMYEFGCWGVPSYRLIDASGKALLALWGQDRLWLFAKEIQRLLGGALD
jgi:2-hydroxychromene-2-carboxylate isomerase